MPTIIQYHSLFPPPLKLYATDDIPFIIVTIDTVIFHRKSAIPPTAIRISTDKNGDLEEETNEYATTTKPDRPSSAINSLISLFNRLCSSTCSGTSIEGPALEW